MAEEYVKVGMKTIVTLLLFALGYVFLGVWWAASTNKTLEFVVQAQAQIQKDVEVIRQQGIDERYRATEAHQAHDELQRQIDELKEK